MDFSNCVEGHLTGISVDEELKTIDFSIRLQAGGVVALKARDVTQFVANEFREKNIIDRINVWNQESKVDSFQHHLLELVTGRTDAVIDGAFASIFEGQLKAISAGEKVLVEIEPVYGARALILAKSLSFE
jgi:hypothetical protein